MNQNTNLTYCYLDCLPKVPYELLQGFEANNQLDPLVQFVDRTADVNGSAVKNSSYTRFQISGKLREWLEFNIVRNAIDYGAAFDNSDRVVVEHFPHVDNSREYSLNYIIDAGGYNVITRFYQQSGLDVTVPADFKFVTEFDKLQEIDSIRVDTGRWVLINTRVIHGVSNLTNLRLSIQISLPKNNKFTQE